MQKLRCPSCTSSGGCWSRYDLKSLMLRAKARAPASRNTGAAILANLCNMLPPQTFPKAASALGQRILRTYHSRLRACDTWSPLPNHRNGLNIPSRREFHKSKCPSSEPRNTEAAAATVVGGTAAESWEPQHHKVVRMQPAGKHNVTVQYRHAVKGSNGKLNEKTERQYDVAHCSKL